MIVAGEERMNKYQEALRASIHTQLERWFEDTCSTIPGEEVYRFLHSIKGTAGTIGLSALSAAAGACMTALEGKEERREEWTPDSLREFLKGLLKAAANGTSAAAAGPIVSAEEDSLLAAADLWSGSNNRPTVLLVDDDPAFLVYLREGLEERGYVVITAQHPEQGMELYHAYDPDCVIIDLVMEHASGFYLLLALRDKMKHQFVPTTIVSADDSRASRIKAYRLGADDYVVKPFDIGELSARLERQLDRKRLFDRMVTTDELTGALRRSQWHETFDYYCKLRLDGRSVAIGVVDIKGLRTLNELRGPAAGDLALQTAGRLLLEQLQGIHASIIRHSGGSFLVLIADYTQEQASEQLRLFAERYADSELLTESGIEGYRSQVMFALRMIEDGSVPASYWLAAVKEELETIKQQAGNDAVGNVNKHIAITIIDDDPIIRSMLTHHAANVLPPTVSIEVRAYPDGETFMREALLEGDSPHIVILDRMMPRMDGFEVLQRLRARANGSRFTILMLTGKKNEADIVQALRLGADEYMTKPFNIRELEARLQRLAKRLY
jgi:two-component system, cell cycle response regulator